MRQIWDTLTDPDATALNAHTPEIDRQGGGYTMIAGAWTIQGNQAATTAVANARAVIDSGTADGPVKSDVMTGAATATAHLIARSNAGATNFWMAGLDDNTQQVQLHSVTAMVATLVASAAFAQDEATAYEVKLVLHGDDIEVYVNDVLMIRHTSALYNAQTYVGFYSNANADARFDNLCVDTRPTCFYCTTADVKSRLGTQWTSGTTIDDELEEAIEEASRIIDRAQGWNDCHYAASDLATVIRYYDGVAGLEMQIDRFLNDAAFAVAVDETATGVYVAWVNGTDYEVWPYNETYVNRILVKYGASKVFPSGQRLVRITGRPGAYSEPPANIRKAAVIIVAKAYKRGLQMYQDTGAVVELGQLVYTQGIDPEVAKILTAEPRRANWG